MRLRIAKIPGTGEVFISRDDLVGALREQAPYAVDPAVAEFARALADSLSHHGSPARQAPALFVPPSSLN